MKKLVTFLFWLICITANAAITHVKVFVQQSVTSSSSTATFTIAATNANDAVCIQAAAAATTLPTGVTITASGWTFTQISPASGMTTWISVVSAASLCAISPNTTSVTFTATFTGGANFSAISLLGDEFTGNDTTGGTTTFDAHNEAQATSGNPTVNVTPANNNDALWGAAQDNTSAVGSGFTKGADDANGDWSEWKILAGGSGSAQTVNFTGSGGFIIQGISIKPASVASTPSVNKRNKIEQLEGG
jgi:hypothetical protein